MIDAGCITKSKSLQKQHRTIQRSYWPYKRDLSIGDYKFMTLYKKTPE